MYETIAKCSTPNSKRYWIQISAVAPTKLKPPLLLHTGVYVCVYIYRYIYTLSITIALQNDHVATNKQRPPIPIPLSQFPKIPNPLNPMKRRFYGKNIYIYIYRNCKVIVGGKNVRVKPWTRSREEMRKARRREKCTLEQVSLHRIKNTAANIVERPRIANTHPPVSVFFEGKREAWNARATAVKLHGKTLTNYWPSRH